MSYSPPIYSPGTIAQNMHNIPRFNSDADFDYEDNDYLIGAFGTGVPFILIGVLLLFLPLWCCLCKRRCCIPKKSSSKFGTYAYIFLIFSVLVGVCLGYYGDIESSVSVQSVKHLVDDVAKYVESSDSVILNIQSQTKANQASVKTFNQASHVSCDNTKTASLEFNTELDAVAATCNAYLNLTDGLAADVRGSEDYFSKFDDGKTLVTAIIFGLSGVCAIMLFFSLLFAKCGRGRRQRCDACTNRFSCILSGCTLPFATILLTTVWVLCGVLLATSVVTSDVCMKPDVLVLDHAPVDMMYYIHCDDTYNATLGDSANEAKTNLNLAVASLTDLKTLATMEGCTGATDMLNTLTTNLNASAMEVEKALDLVSCESMNGLYTQFMYDVFCGDVLYGFVVTFVSLFVIGFFLMCVVCCQPRCASPEAFAIRSAMLMNNDYALDEISTKPGQMHA